METADIQGEPEMNRRKITLPDGRYLLFYTFEATVSEPEADQKDEGAEEIH